MNICLISREYPTDEHMGGVATYTEKTARALVRLGQSVTVITEALGAPSVRIEEGVEVRRLAPIRRHNLRMAARAWAVGRAVATLPVAPDIVQACEYGAEAFWISLRRPKGAKLITRLATPSYLVHQLNANSQRREFRSRYYIGALERIQTRRSDAIFSVSDALAEVVCGQWSIRRDRVRTIPNGVDFAERFAAGPREMPHALRDKAYLIYVGRLEERKGVHILAEALPGVLKTYPQLHAVFVGNNAVSYRGEGLQAYVERCNRAHPDRVHFFPRLSHQDLYPLVHGAQVAVFPSLWEACGNVSLEAQDAGTPVVATTGSGFSEQIDDGMSGVLVPPGDVPALRRALIAILADPVALREMSRAAKQRAQQLQMNRVTEQLLRFYQDVMASGRVRVGEWFGGGGPAGQPERPPPSPL